MTEEKKKQFRYRGKELEELKELGVREFAKYLNSRERRTILRNFQEIENFVNRAEKKIQNNKNVKTHKRNIIIVPKMVGMYIRVHNGNKFVPIEITTEKLGHRLGEFVPTRTRVKHGSAGVGSTKGNKALSKK